MVFTEICGKIQFEVEMHKRFVGKIGFFDD
jgi:hypothetical protein